ncbi:MAG: hypothetical protein QNJ07_05975 [Woeseiaceae bacterium]|nr:hypothetical protein [Woeseiaceae bacterium]
MKHGVASQIRYAVLAFAGLVVMSGSASAEDNKSAYSMAVIIDAAEGRDVRKGKYEQAIAKLTEAKRNRTDDEFARSTNLCVAYTKTGELEKAEIACDQAVMLYADNRFEPERYRALALSNRGVLRAVKGDVELARADFEAATEIYRLGRFTKDNLARVAMETSSQG